MEAWSFGQAEGIPVGGTFMAGLAEVEEGREMLKGESGEEVRAVSELGDGILDLAKLRKAFVRSLGRDLQIALPAWQALGNAAAVSAPAIVLGPGNPNALPSGAQGAADTAVNGQYQRLLQDKDASFDSKKEAAVAKVRELGTKAQMVVDRGIARASGPAALRGDLDIAALTQIVELRKEQALYTPEGLTKIHDSLCQSGDTRGEDLFQIACAPLLNELIALSGPKLAERLEMKESRSGAVDAQRLIAIQLRARIQARIAERMPSGLKAARDALARMLVGLSKVLGVHGSMLTRGEIATYYVGAQLKDPYAANPRWLQLSVPRNPPVEAYARSQAAPTSPWA